MRKKRSCDIALVNDPEIIVAGAGAIGCYVGGMLAAAGYKVTLLMRPRVAKEIRTHGLTLTDYAGQAKRVSAETLILTQDPACLAKADIVLVTVKSGATALMGRSIADRVGPNTKIVSLQNGTENAETLREVLPNHDVRAGMVPFNVVPLGEGGYHRATSGDIVIGTGPGELAQTLSMPRLSLREDADITALQWGKFLINLSNATNALSGMPLQQQLQDRGWRTVMAAQWAEALKVLRAHGIKPKSTTPVGVRTIPWILRLPTPLFRRIAASMLTIDAAARSSMSHDLMMGRATEVDVLQGQVVRMGLKVGRKTPLNARVLELVQLAELADEGLPNLPAKAIRSDG